MARDPTIALPTFQVTILLRVSFEVEAMDEDEAHDLAEDEMTEIKVDTQAGRFEVVERFVDDVTE